MKTFFKKAGNAQLRFKPAYNPYTEPSMEVFSYHEGLKKWIEVGNVSQTLVGALRGLQMLTICTLTCGLMGFSVWDLQTGDVEADGFT